jgi:coenzyme F420-0:L-glutamate ligase/coenzyme F420-1:gamma-L-glutamate ligase
MTARTSAMEFDGHSLLYRRKSVRHYRPEAPTVEALERILTSAALAPSAHNRQPWRFLVVADHNLKVRLARGMGARLATDRLRDGDSDAAIANDVDRSFRRITSAPVVILVALTLVDMDSYPDEARAHAEWLMAVQSTAMAGQNLLLAAEAEGLGTCWMCAPLFCEADVKRVLTVPDDWQVQGLITLGAPARAGSPKVRKPLRDYVAFAKPDHQ